jgi:hypothetical protein
MDKKRMGEIMDNNIKEQEEFLLELRILTDKYKLKNVIFGGKVNDRFWGFIGITPITDLRELTENVAISLRLYQYAREKIFNVFDDMAR